MVTVQTTPQIEARPITLTELGEHLGILITVRPWWGSARQGPFTARNGVKVPGRWICPVLRSFSRPPEVHKGVVLMWEGPCRDHYGRRWHTHRQNIEVLSVGERAFLVRVRQGSYGSHFLIGMDDGHPFVSPVLRRLKTVQDAFDWLVPKVVKIALAQGLDVKRQGDWYFIPYDRPVRETRARQVPLPWHGMIRHGVENNVVYSDGPLFQRYGPPTRHIGERVVYRSYPWPLVRGTVTAPDHPPLHLPSWHQAVRTLRVPSGNTDIRPRLDD